MSNAPETPNPAPDRVGWSKPLPEVIPPPTFCPVFFSAGIVFLAWGPLTSWVLSAVGFGLIILALRIWLGELRKDWKKTASSSSSSPSHE